MKNKKSMLARLLACMLVLVMILSLAACGGDKPTGSNDNPGGVSQSGNDNPGGGEPASDAKATRFEAEYANITGSVPGFLSVFSGASNDCWLEPVEGCSNGFVVAALYADGNDDNLPVITFTITSDVEAEATIALAIGPGWAFDDSFNTVYQDTNAGTDYPLTFNGTALSSSDTVKGSEIAEVRNDDGDVVKQASDIIVANYGTVTLKAGENTFSIQATANSRCIDYLEITTTANVTMEEDHTHTYRAYSEEDFEYVEIAV